MEQNSFKHQVQYMMKGCRKTVKTIIKWNSAEKLNHLSPPTLEWQNNTHWHRDASFNVTHTAKVLQSVQRIGYSAPLCNSFTTSAEPATGNLFSGKPPIKSPQCQLLQGIFCAWKQWWLIYKYIRWKTTLSFVTMLLTAGSTAHSQSTFIYAVLCENTASVEVLVSSGKQNTRTTAK